MRHEEAAAFAAVDYAKFSGKLGVCLATTGPGAIHLLNGLYDAKMDQQPVLALTGMPYHDLIGTTYQQDVDTAKLFSDATVFSERIMGSAHVLSMVDQAIRLALSRPGAAHLAFPNDFQDKPAQGDTPSPMNMPGGSKTGVHTSPVWSAPRVVPTQTDLQSAAQILNEGKKVALLIGLSGRGRGTHGRKWSKSPTCWRRRLPKRCSAKTFYPTTIRTRRKRLACTAHRRRKKR